VFVESQRAVVEFWENAFRNVGLDVCGFQEEAAALEWLNKKA
jgi:hypothetical protein